MSQWYKLTHLRVENNFAFAAVQSGETSISYMKMVVYALSRHEKDVYVGLTTLQLMNRRPKLCTGVKEWCLCLNCSDARIDRALREDMVAFKVRVLEQCPDIEGLCAAEVRWIKELGTHKSMGGLNMTWGGEHPSKWSRKYERTWKDVVKQTCDFIQTSEAAYLISGNLKDLVPLTFKKVADVVGVTHPTIWKMVNVYKCVSSDALLFFDVAVPTGDGMVVARRYVLALIKDFLELTPQASDSVTTKHLRDVHNIVLNRRTVAKYRHQLLQS